MLSYSRIHRGTLLWPVSAVLVALLFMPSIAIAGPLGDFEAEATKKRVDEWRHETAKSQRTPTSSTDQKSGAELEGRCRDLFLCLFSDLFGGLINAIVKGSSEMSMTRALRREHGDHDLPLVGADINFQTVSQQINAVDGRAELGYGPMAVQLRGAHFSDKEYAESLNVAHAHALFRISGNPAFQVNFGLGGVLLNGKNTNSGLSTTIPTAIFPRDAWGARFVPTWSWINGNRISDYDGSLEYTQRFYSGRLGYRTSYAGDQSLSGPYIGFSFHY